MDSSEKEECHTLVNSNLSSKLDREEEKLGLYAALSYIIIVLGVGIPVWWNTTNTYRVPLPYDKLNSIDKLFIQHHCEVNIYVHDSLPLKQVHEFVKTQLGVGNIVNYSVTVDIFSDQMRDLFSSCILNDIEETLSKSVYNKPGSIYVWITDCTESATPIIIGKYRNLFIQNRTLVTSDKFIHLIQHIVGEEDLRDDMYSFKHGATNKHIRRLQPHSGIDILFSYVNPDPQETDPLWNIEYSVNVYLAKLIKMLEPLSLISISAQSVYFTTLQVPFHFDEIDKVFYIRDQNLPLTINPIEGHLSSYVSTNPVLHFILYITPEKHNPLFIKHEKSFSDYFISPRWGGMVLWNTVNSSSEVNMRKVLGQFSSQFRILLGLSDINFQDVSQMNLGLNGISGIEYDFLTRIRILERVISSQNTLKSLSELLGKINNIVIKDEVGAHVNLAASYIEECIEYLNNKKLDEAVVASMNAYISSEKAFFDPSMLSLLYFPDDQKYAIYVPLFLPVGIPIIVSCYRILRSMFSKSSK